METPRAVKLRGAVVMTVGLFVEGAGNAEG